MRFFNSLDQVVNTFFIMDTSVVSNILNYVESLPIFTKSGIAVAIFLLIATAYLLLKPSAEQQLTRDLRNCYKELEVLIVNSMCQPIMLRLAWSDAMTFDSSIKSWPSCGGVNGSIRLDHELNMNENAGLTKAIALLTPLSRRYRNVSWADLIQMAAVISVHTTGGPYVELDYGRIDAPTSMYDANDDDDNNGGNRKTRKYLSTFCDRFPNLPCSGPPYPDGAPSADVHLRNIFYRLGLNNRDTVALCGSHTLGRGFKDRTGVCPFSSGDQGATIYTCPTAIVRNDKKPGVGMAGGCSWTKNWLTFDNSYYLRVCSEHSPITNSTLSSSSTQSTVDEQLDTSQLLWLPTDQALYDCPEFRPYFLRYAADQNEFFKDYSIALRKMSELGARFRYVIKLNISK